MANIHAPRLSMGQRPAARSRTVVPAIAARFSLAGLFDKTAVRGEKKQKLLELIAPLQRGLAASADDAAAVEAAVQELEKLNPTPRPLASPLINGKWELRYTTSESILGTKKPALLRPSGPIYQLIDAEALTARNQETAPLFNSVSATLSPMSVNKVAVQFQVFKIGGLLPIKAPPTARGELAFTYLDDEMRISRGDKGNLFVLTMADRSEKP